MRSRGEEPEKSISLALVRVRAPLASRISQHRTSYITQAPATQATRSKQPLETHHLLEPYKPARTLRSSIRLKCVPFNLKSFGLNRSFTVRTPQLWNSLPIPVRSTENISTFKSRLKTHLKLAYDP